MGSQFSGVGVVMAGGRSRRMGREKALIQINGVPLVKHQYDLLWEFCEKVYVSCAQKQEQLFEIYPLVIDQYEDIGPLGGIGTALERFSDSPILVLAVDMPVISTEVISDLIAARDNSKDATVVRASDNQYLQPLVAIYEPTVLKHVRDQLSADQFAMHKLLSVMQIQTVDVDDALLVNLNSQDQLKGIDGLK